MRKLLFCSLLLSNFAYAALQPLDNTDMQAVEAQGGADISWQLTLNQDASYNFNCTNLPYCRLGLSLNNRNHDGTPTGSATGKKLWLVFKGIQGSINLQQVKLDGVDLTYGSITKPAIQLSYDPLKPIQIRNFGYNALSIETDTIANEGAGNVPGYLAMGSGGSGVTAYTNGLYSNATNAFDFNRETGFTGLNMNGNLSLAGTVKIFSCDSTHPRC